MKKASLPMRSFATHLRAYEMRENKTSSARGSFQITDKLQPHLTTFMGGGGFRALISRALTLAANEVPWLKGVSVKANGDLDGWDKLTAQLDPKLLLDGEVVLLAQLFGLLAAFIGEILTLRLVHEIWPKLPLTNVDFGIGDKK